MLASLFGKKKKAQLIAEIEALQLQLETANQEHIEAASLLRDIEAENAILKQRLDRTKQFAVVFQEAIDKFAIAAELLDKSFLDPVTTTEQNNV